ncbi:MAG: HlyD family efflux transporter periplasmic adaptor subunit [Gemmataceae bacterium]|nr:HlyD family efflux transporter periplasmic adaptor subunit [Gemmataceae bacterium]
MRASRFLILVLLASGCAAPPETPPPAAPADAVGALGRLEPGWKVHQVAPPAMFEPARVEKLLIEEGRLVRKGEVLAELDILDRREAAVREARAAVAVAQARLSLVLAGAKREEIAAQKALVDQHRASVENAEANLARARPLRTGAAVSVEEYDKLRMMADTARQAHLQAKRTLAALELVRPEDAALARAELERAKAGVAKAEADAEACRVRSPLDGVVLKIHARAGEKVGDKGLAEVGDTANMEAVAEVHEADVPLVRVGQRATVRLRTRAGTELSGTVRHVGLMVGRRVVLDNDPVKDADARVVEVRVRLDSASTVAGLSYAQVEVVIRTGKE